MGQSSGLTNYAMVDPATGMTNFFDVPAENRAEYNDTLANARQYESANGGPRGPFVVQPSFAQAASGGILSPALTTKGKILSAILRGVRGIGDAVQGGAFAPHRWGEAGSFSRGFGAAEQLPIIRQRGNLVMQNENLRNQMLQQQMQLLPLTYQDHMAGVREKLSQVDLNRAHAKYFQNRIDNPKMDAYEQRQQVIDEHPEWSSEQKQSFLTTGKMPTAPSPRILGGPAQGIVAVNPDLSVTDIRPPAPKAKGGGKPKAEKPSNPDELSAGEQRTLATDPEWSAAKRTIDELVKQKAKQGAYLAPEDAARFDTQIAAQQQRMNARRDAVLSSRKKSGGNVAPEGTVVSDENGNQLVKRNGKWVPASAPSTTVPLLAAH